MALDEGVRREAYLGKARSEIAQLAAQGVEVVGNAFAAVLIVKGELADGELERGLLGGADGKALRAALTALGYVPEEWCALATVRRDATALEGPLLRRAVTTLDPATLVVCDDRAAMAVREAYAEELSALETIDEALLAPGLVVQVAGMRMLNLGGFEAALSNERDKQRVWAYLKQLPPLGEPY